jgi:hypothetical protein
MTTTSNEHVAARSARRMATMIVGAALLFAAPAGIGTTGASATASAATMTESGVTIDRTADDGPPVCGPARDGHLWRDPWNGSVWQCRFNGCYWGWFMVIPGFANDDLANNHGRDTTTSCGQHAR